MPRKNILKAITSLIIAELFFLTACSTSIKLAVERPPNLNTAGIKRIAIMPFEANSGGDLGHGSNVVTRTIYELNQLTNPAERINANTSRELAQYATNLATTKIRSSNYFTLVDPSEIERFKRSNQNLENYIDAQFIGRITRISAENETKDGSYKNKDGVVIYYTDYITKVEIEFNYSLVLARDSRIIGPITKKGSRNSSSREKYPSAIELLRAVIDEQMRYIERDIAPYTAIETRTFAVEKSKDKELKAEMKEALTQVKAGNYRQAHSTYLDIYSRYNNIAAAENVAILYESFGEVQTAADFMQEVLRKTGNPRASVVLTRLNRILQDKAILANDYGDTRDQTRKAADLASDEIQKVLPKNARVWIYNDSVSNPIAVGVVDNLTSDFITKGIKIVDRQNKNLIEAEQQLNMSGFISDNDFLSIGNAVGANIIVVVGITGTGSMRRLQVRVLDIEKSIALMQSDASDKWKI